MDYRKIMLKQLALDYNTTPEALQSGKNLFIKSENAPEKRSYENGSGSLKVLCINGIIVCNAADQNLLDVLKEKYEHRDGCWFVELGNLHQLDEILQQFSQRTSEFHQYYIPSQKVEESNGIRLASDEIVVWYEGKELEQFRDDDRFDEALAFAEDYPDELAVTIQKNGEILGMAGASSDSDNMWQIGVNVMPEGRGRGIATKMTRLLKQAILEKGKLPFYGTAASHIISQRVAVGSGFEPAWGEVFTKN